MENNSECNVKNVKSSLNSKAEWSNGEKPFVLNGNSKAIVNNDTAGNLLNGFINYENNGIKNSLQKHELTSEENIESVAEFIKNSNNLNGVFISKGVCCYLT